MNGLPVPAPDYLCAIGTKHKRVEKGRWRIFTPRHKPEDSLYGHLKFALKYEGIDLMWQDCLHRPLPPMESSVHLYNYARCHGVANVSQNGFALG